MKKLLVALTLLSCSFGALADLHGPRHHQYHRIWKPGYGWVIPTVIGGVISYELIRQRPVVVVEREEITVTGTCSEWREIQEPGGRIYRERTCTK